MNLRFLETFIWVARLCNFTGAALRLNSSQAAVSGRIVALERELGVSLFERRGRSVTLTAEGARALPQAERIVELYAGLKQSVSPASSTLTRVRIAVGGSIAHSFLADFLEDFATAWPDVTIELVTAGSTENAATALLGGRVDLAMLMGPLPQPEVNNVELCQFAVRWVASPALTLPTGALTLYDLARHPILSFPEGSPPYLAVQRRFCDAAIKNPRLNALQSMPTAIQLARDGMGVAALPPAVIREDLARGTLLLLPIEPALPPLRFTASFRRGQNDAFLGGMADLARRAAWRFCQGCDPTVAFQAASENLV